MRIVGGKAKGTILLSPAGKNTTRPTLGRVRESIFNVLANVGLEEAKVLDIFAGTGAMGLEALSRGAAEAVFIDRTTSDIIRKNAERCHMSGQVKVIARDVTPALKLLGGKSFDYIFMDPPYRKGYINEILKEILSCGICSDDAIIVAEHSVSKHRTFPFSKTGSTSGKRRNPAPLLLLICVAELQRSLIHEISYMPGKF